MNHHEKCGLVRGGVSPARSSSGKMICALLCAVIITPLAGPPPADAATGISCHCFQDRTFDPEKPSAADEYILATTFNTLLAEHFSIPKRQIVMMKMNGVGGGNLLVALYVSRSTESPLDPLLGARQRGASWTDTLKSVDGAPDRLDADFRALVGAGDDAALEDHVADVMISRHLGASARDLAALRKEGAGMKARALDALLGRHAKKPPGFFFRQVSRGEKSWGRILAELDLEPETANELIGTTPRREGP